MNSGSGRIWKKAMWPKPKYYTGSLPGRTEKNHKISQPTYSVSRPIFGRYPPNMKQKYQPLGHYVQ
jgi:hypothetical protein